MRSMKAAKNASVYRLFQISHAVVKTLFDKIKDSIHFNFPIYASIIQLQVAMEDPTEQYLYTVMVRKSNALMIMHVQAAAASWGGCK